jgi:hypothetical protein
VEKWPIDRSCIRPDHVASTISMTLRSSDAVVMRHRPRGKGSGSQKYWALRVRHLAKERYAASENPRQDLNPIFVHEAVSRKRAEQLGSADQCHVSTRCVLEDGDFGIDVVADQDSPGDHLA